MVGVLFSDSTSNLSGNDQLEGAEIKKPDVALHRADVDLFNNVSRQDKVIEIHGLIR